jgi:hypothetical protein
MDDIKNSEASRELLIAEFYNLRQEQFARTNAQQVLVNLNVTAAVTLGAIAIASDKRLILLIFAPDVVRARSDILRTGPKYYSHWTLHR